MLKHYVYLAAPYGSREQIAKVAERITAIGHQVTSSWLQETHDIVAGTQGAAVDLTDAQVDKHARTDILDIDDSSVFVLFTSAYVGVEGGGGRHVETGLALAQGIPVFVIGEPENVFHRLRGKVRVLPDADALIAVLR